MIIAFNVIFVVYTCLGGIVSVVWTELIQGLVILVFGAIGSPLRPCIGASPSSARGSLPR